MLFVRLLLFLLCGAPALAQLTQVGRLELPINPSANETYSLLPLGERGGLLTYHRIDDYTRQPHNFKFTRLDTALAARWAVDYKLPERYVPIQRFDNEQYVFHLYAEPNTDRIAVMRLQIDDGLTDFYEGQMPSQIDLTQFKVMGNLAYLSGYYRSRPVVMAFSLFDRTFRVFQGLYVNHMELGNMEVDPYRQEVHVLTYSPKKRCQFTVRSYSPDGKPLRIIEYDGTQYSLITGKILPISADESLLVGNYSADCTPYSQGIYITRIQHNETGKLTVTTDHGEAIRYFDFSKLKNFFNYLKPKRQQKILAKVEKKRELGKDYKFRYRLLVHDLMPTPTGMRVIAEVYFPQYKSSSLPMMSTSARNTFLATQGLGPSLMMLPNNRQPLDRYTTGYQYTHAFICEFDNAGNLLWDNCLPINDLIDLSLDQKVQVLPQGDRIVMAYPQEGDIATELIERDSVLRAQEVLKKATGNDKERIQSNVQDDVLAWYGVNFLGTGYQKIVNNQNTSQPVRDVFYLNKLRYNVHPAAPVEARK